jgi:hypothetical protein
MFQRLANAMCIYSAAKERKPLSAVKTEATSDTPGRNRTR